MKLEGVMRPRLEMTNWIDLANTVDSLQDEVMIAIVGKYTGFADAYLSIIKV